MFQKNSKKNFKDALKIVHNFRIFSFFKKLIMVFFFSFLPKTFGYFREILIFKKKLHFGIFMFLDSFEKGKC
jgi:hypothetical protein